MVPPPALVSKTLALGAGSYRGTEQFVLEIFQRHHPGSISHSRVGFMHPCPSNHEQPPTYQDVCGGCTGFVEVLFIGLTNPTPDIVKELFKFFFMFHDPTTKNQQGNDRGTQYASTIFCADQRQQAIARQIKGELQAAIDDGKNFQYQQSRIHTKIVALTQFYPAHQEHQGYCLRKKAVGDSGQYIRFQEWPTLDRSPEQDMQPTARVRPTHRRWNRRSLFFSFSNILAQLVQDQSREMGIEKVKPTHRRWNRNSIFASFSKILNEIEL